ncbi:MAG TPA: hypothetical protein VFB06_23360 [Streptosporangiaceae bacterium]|nr:hypothetical protein [Streptosporangiaceae bacterium]
MPGTPARSGGVILAGSGVLAIVAVTAGAGLAVIATATPAQAQTVPLTADPSTAMPGLPVTFTIKCNPPSKSATLFGETIGLNGPVSMKSARAGVFAVTVNLPTGLTPGVREAVARCENGDSGIVDLTVNAPPPPPTPTPSPMPPKPTYRPPPPPPTAAPITGDGATSAPGGMSTSAMAGLGVLGAGGIAGLAALRRLRKPRG